MRNNFRYALLPITAVVAIMRPTPSAGTMLNLLVSMTALYLFAVVIMKYRRAKHRH
jgi:Sec-independent protein secretion pathway component TatC